MNFLHLQAPLFHSKKLEHGFLSNHNAEFAAILEKEEPKICTMKQVHGKKLVWLSSLEKRTQEADALATTQPNLALGVHSADCSPILVAAWEKDAPVGVMAIHAGWRGTAQKIAFLALSEFLETMRNQHHAERFEAVIGPCIQFAQFEVGEEVVQAFPGSEEKGLAKFLRNEEGKKKYLFDLPGENGRQLLEAAAAKSAKLDLEILPLCTVLEKDNFPSYRRDREKAGRILSWIRFQQ